MPFLYFFFAVTGWVKGLFEAMVGIPLWALAHIRIDGEGLPGDAAQAGYFLIFEIFLRPIIIVMSLLAAILSFSAMVLVLNDIFFLVVSNLSGFNPNNASACGMTNATGLNRLNTLEYFRGPVDEFFFTIMYALIVYLIGMSTFKLIDTIPNGLLRWMNFTLPTFHDGQEQPAENLVQNVAIGGGAIGGKLAGAGKQLGEAFESGGKFLGDTNVRAGVEDKFK
jgi:conjugal transfer/type IV secretion protein DotA/TraY